MAGNKTLNARLSLKYDTYANWTSNNPVLLAGEAAVTVVPGETGAVQREPAVLVKFGDGTSHYNDLQFMSAKSADVYDWAMQAQKPTYQASEIQGLDDYISGQIKDTDTQYQLVRVSDTSFKLQSKEKNGEEWADVTTIEITYTLTEGETNGTVKFNGVDVAVYGLKSAAYQDTTAFDAAGSADAAKVAVIGTSGDQSSAGTIYGAKKYAEEKASAAQSAAVSEATTASNGYTDSAIGTAKTELIGDAAGVTANTIKGGVAEAKSYTDEQINAKISSVYKPAGSSTFESLPQPAVGILGNVYDVTNEFTADGKFIAEEVGTKYPAGTNVAVVLVDGEYKYDAMSGKIDLSGYATKVDAQGYATTAKSEAISAAATDAAQKVNAAKTELIGTGSATSTTIKDAVAEANAHSDALNTAMDARVKNVEGTSHTHTNKALLDTYTQTEANLADAVTKKHDHSNKTVLDAITQGKITSWDGKADDASLAAIAKSGKIQDLIQDAGTYIVIDCGTATTNI